MYYINYIHKEPCMVSYNTNMHWSNKVSRGHWKLCVNIFEMNTMTLLSLCNDLETQYWLKLLKRISVSENVAMFLYIIALGALNRKVQKRFQHSGKIFSRYINEVLIVACFFVVDVIKPIDFKFTNILREIAMNPRFMPHFKVRCILFIVGAINLNCLMNVLIIYNLNVFFYM